MVTPEADTGSGTPSDGSGPSSAPTTTTDDGGLLGPLLPIARGSRTPLVRTAFEDDAAWRTVAEALTGRSDQAGWDSEEASLVDAVSDRRYADLDVARLAGAWPQDLLAYAIVADAMTMKEVGARSSVGRASVLYVDLTTERGDSFRSAVDQVPDIAMNLSIANMDFFEFADAVGPDGVFRGFS